MQMYAAVHRDVSDATGKVIDGAARMLLPTERWVMGDGPATHAFLWWKLPDNTRMRIDAQPPCSVLTHQKDIVFPIPTVSWKLPISDAKAGELYERCAKHKDQGGLVGWRYDYGELVLQVAPGVWDVEMHPARLICTNLTIKGLMMAGFNIEPANGSRHPEALARELRIAAAAWAIAEAA